MGKSKHYISIHMICDLSNSWSTYKELWNKIKLNQNMVTKAEDFFKKKLIYDLNFLTQN